LIVYHYITKKLRKTFHTVKAKEIVERELHFVTDEDKKRVAM
jgi:hypothetical protein